ncbi:MAG: protein phosphatase 2C domain-containing protein [Thermodesulfobacteriota bacterium]
METWATTHIGRVRRQNQDRFLVHAGRDAAGPWTILAVADGLGGVGQTAGEEAAAAAVQALADFRPPALEPPAVEWALEALVRELDSRLLARGQETPREEAVSTTLTAVVLRGQIATWVHVGDSRLYCLSRDRLWQVTTDHNEAQEMVLQGLMTPEEAAISPARQILARAVGCPDCLPDTGSFPVAAGDLLLLCSDGLAGAMDRQRLAAILAKPDPLAALADELVQAALAVGGRDNITVVLARL